MLKAYYDCGNKLDSLLYKTVTLAGLFGRSKSLARFEREWDREIMKQGARYLHTKDAIALENEFSEEYGWTREKVSTLISSLIPVIEHANADGVGLISGTLFLGDYRDCKNRVPDLVEPEHLLSSYCVGKAIVTHKLSFPKDDGRIALFFDRDEPFYGHIRNMWQRRDLQRTETWSSIKQISEVSSDVFPGIQAADLLSWSINAAFRDNKLSFDWQLPLHNIPRDKELMDAQYLYQDRIAANVERYQNLKLPRRREMR